MEPLKRTDDEKTCAVDSESCQEGPSDDSPSSVPESQSASEVTQSSADNRMFCETHAEKVVEFFCSDCKLLICSACRETNHSSCSEVMTVAEAAVIRRTELLKERELMEAQLRVTKENLEKQLARKQKLIQDYANAQTVIQRATNTVVAQVRTTEAALLEEVKRLYTN